MPSYKKFSQLLARVNFPLYTVHCLTERHILVAGGGGGSKTGISNVIEIYELINNGSTCRAESVIRYETGSVAIMNCSVFNAGNYFILFAGMEGNCQLYKIKYTICDHDNETSEKEEDSEDEKNNSSELRKRLNKESVPAENNSKASDTNDNELEPHLCFTINPLDAFQTDFNEDPFQKLVRFSNVSKLFATAGSDGHIRVWKFPTLNKLYEIHAHDDDVDDIDICPLGKKIASVSRDGHGKLWNCEDGKLISELVYTLPSKYQEKYIFRSCRFGVVQENKSLPLFTTLNPAARKKPPSPSFICKWNNSTMERIVSVGTDMLSVMAVSDDGLFLGLGTQDGSVKIYISFSLQLLYNVDHVHGIFVTGLEFLHTSEEARRITGGHEASLISISVDNHINIHHIPVRGTMGIMTLMTLFLLTLFCIFVIMDFFNL